MTQEKMSREEFLRWAVTVEMVEQAEKDEDRYWAYVNSHKQEFWELSEKSEEQMNRLIDILFRAERVENLMQMSVEEVLALPEEMLD